MVLKVGSMEAFGLVGALAILMSFCAEAEATECPVASDMTKGVQVTHQETKERTTFRRTREGLILETRMAQVQTAPKPRQRLLHAGILGVQEIYDDGRELRLVYDEGPIFPELPMPEGRYKYLGHAVGDRRKIGLYDEFRTNGPTATLRIGWCEYRTQIVTFASIRTRGSGKDREVGTGIGRIFLSEELGFPLRREWYANTSFRQVVTSETVTRIEKLANAGGL